MRVGTAVGAASAALSLLLACVPHVHVAGAPPTIEAQTDGGVLVSTNAVGAKICGQHAGASPICLTVRTRGVWRVRVRVRVARVMSSCAVVLLVS